MTSLVLLATEASGDLLGARLMAELKNQGFKGEFLGIGGTEMIKQGLQPFLPLSKVSLLAFIDVALHGIALLWRMRQTANKIIQAKPKALILIDSYDFNHRVARSVFRRGGRDIKIINYVPPKAWAWREGRAKKMKDYITHALVLLPFEEDFFQSHGVSASYVGHPALEHSATPTQAEAFRARFPPNKKLILVALGSRAVELKHLGKIFASALPLIKAQEPEAEFLMPLAEIVSAQTQEAIASWEIKPILIKGEEEKKALFAAADVALVSSGTITLELGLSGTASVCVYCLNIVEEKIIKLIANMRLVHLVNLVLQEEAFPQLLGKDVATPQALADATIELLNKDNASVLARFKQKLTTPKPPSVMAAQKVLELIAD